MKITKHGKCMNFVCENCGCEWRAVEKECKEVGFFEAPPRYLYKCPECGKNTWGTKIEAEDKIDGEE